MDSAVCSCCSCYNFFHLSNRSARTEGNHSRAEVRFILRTRQMLIESQWEQNSEMLYSDWPFYQTAKISSHFFFDDLLCLNSSPSRRWWELNAPVTQMLGLFTSWQRKQPRLCDWQKNSTYHTKWDQSLLSVLSPKLKPDLGLKDGPTFLELTVLL